jgi:hypothetical protein
MTSATVENWKPPAELDIPLPRPVRMTALFKWTLALLVTPLFPVLFLIPAMTASDYITHKLLLQRGINIDAELAGHYVTQGTHGRNVYHVDFKFTPNENYRFGFVNSSSILPEEIYNFIIRYPKIPIVYDPERPERIETNINGSFYHDHTVEIVVVGALLELFFIAVVFIPAMWVRYKCHSEKELLSNGETAPATIVGERESHWTRRPSSNVMYQFVDAKGVRVTGTRKYVPTASDSRPGFPERRAQFLNNPTVLFDPNDSRKNMLFPLDMAELK